MLKQVICIVTIILSFFSNNPVSGINLFQNPDNNIAEDFKSIRWPWAGGLNACQFCSIDLNLDGVSDLLVFDRHGNKSLTFISSLSQGYPDYILTTEYSHKIPLLHDWVQTVDYNCDGRMDIFTYGNGGIRVFENVSDTTLMFELKTDLLESYYYNGYVGILVTSVDYPAIADIDGDGDLDLLTFFGLGSFVEFHKNLSLEKYGNCDSFDFKLTDPCWGKFRESESGNRITLNADCPYQSQANSSGQAKPRHTGSTMVAIDLNNDGLKDLLLGDIDYPGITALYNGGTTDSAHMVSFDTIFPAGTNPINLFSFPALSLADLNHDGLNDLVVSPFDPGLGTSDNYNCVWYYQNSGTHAQPIFDFSTSRKFLENMLDFGSASHPVLVDFDKDGLDDLFVGNLGYYDSSWYQNGFLKSQFTGRISYFRNTGTHTNPVFSNITDDLANISSPGYQGIYPAFSDVNHDGLTDLVTGGSDGKLLLFLQKQSPSAIPQFESPVANWQGIDVGSFSTPQFFDLDGDQVDDLVAGETNGNLNYYQGTVEGSELVFKFVTDSLGKINVTNYNLSYNGFSTPCFGKYPDGNTFLLVGSDEGRIHYFSDIDQNLSGKFTPTDTLFQWISSTPGDTLFGWQTSPAIAHLTDQNDFDLITGNFSGGLNYLSKRAPAQIIPGNAEMIMQKTSSIALSPNPADQFTMIQIPTESHGSEKVSVYDIFGHLILEFNASSKTRISTADFANGVYILRMGNASALLVVMHRQ